MKILHIAEAQIFTKPFFSLIEKNFSSENHEILSRGKINCWPKEFKISNHTLSGLTWIYYFLINSRKFDKIILHSLFDTRVILLLILYPSILKKCYWMIWGGDLYSRNLGKKNLKWHILEFFRRPVIRRIGHLVTYVPGDVELAREWYGATGKHHDCLMYTSNIYREHKAITQPHTTINIQIGNSAAPSNNHLEIIEKLKPFASQDVAIYAPLSYGDDFYARKVIDKGYSIFGEKFKPMTTFLPFDQYLDFLGKIDIAIFNHKRQQAMGNTITLLGLGKKIYMRSDITPWSMFEKLQIKVFDVKNIEISKISETSRACNIENVRNRFSEPRFLQELNNIFTSK